MREDERRGPKRLAALRMVVPVLRSTVCMDRLKLALRKVGVGSRVLNHLIPKLDYISSIPEVRILALHVVSSGEGTWGASRLISGVPYFHEVSAELVRDVVSLDRETILRIRFQTAAAIREVALNANCYLPEEIGFWEMSSYKRDLSVDRDIQSLWSKSSEERAFELVL